MVQVNHQIRVAVIGSGFGGLAAAIRLQAAGINAVLFEARETPGGRANTFIDQGYIFDTGPTVITAPSCLTELFLLGKRSLSDYVEFIPIKPFYRLLWHDGDQFDYGIDWPELLEQIRRRNSCDVLGYQRFFEFSRRNFEVGYNELVATPFLHFRDMLRVTPQLLRLRSDRSVYQTVSRYIRDDRLRQALSFHTLLIGGNPLETSSIYTLIHYLEYQWGVFFPRGGIGALVQGLVKLFQELGGELRLATPVHRISIDSTANITKHYIITHHNAAEPFDLTISNADLHHTYATLLKHDSRAENMRQRLTRASWSMSLFMIYFGTDCKYPGLAHHTIIFGPRYKRLLHDIFHGTILPQDFSLYLHAPTVTDPTLAPPSGETFYVLSPVPHLGQATIDWQTIGPQYAERILAYLERIMPNLRQHIVTRTIVTPLDFRDKLGAYNGNGFSLAPHLTQSAWFRPHNRDAVIPGLYLVGAGTHPGAGVPGVINSAKATVNLILQDLKSSMHH